MSEGCLFCQIIAGDVPAKEAYSGPLAYGFWDLEPQAPLHVLIVPRRHIADASTVTPADAAALAEMMAAGSQVVAEAGYGERGYRMVFNVGHDAGNTVPHLHMHVLAGRDLRWPPG
ncbi:MAG TPA: HIT domain-containing protein [Acidimicrobiales bacterium]|nr:HIT domain-containing protein [Acidimicrobiales bacterium]